MSHIFSHLWMLDFNLQICVFPFQYSQRLRNYLEAMRVGDDIQERVSRLYEMVLKKKLSWNNRTRKGRAEVGDK